MGLESQERSENTFLSANDFEFITFLILVGPFVLMMPYLFLRALISLLSLFIYFRLLGKNIWFGDLRSGVASSSLAFIMTLPFLTFADLEYSNASPLEMIRALLQQIAISLWEESFFRGALSKSAFQFTLSSSIFSFMHSLNPGFSLLPLINLFIMGIFLCFLRIRLGLLSSISFHFSWNLFLEHLWGFPVSGILGVSILSSRIIGPQLLTGGDFGPEGSLITTIEFSFASLLLRREDFLSRSLSATQRRVPWTLS